MRVAWIPIPEHRHADASRRGALGAMLALVALGCWPFGGAPAFAADVPDTSSARTSETGAFSVSVESRTDPIPPNELHAWTVRVETPGGEPVLGAEIDVDGGMPMHDHGLPTAPRVTQELGDGEYLLEGVKFQMPGHWRLTFGILAAGTQDSVTFDLLL